MSKRKLAVAFCAVMVAATAAMIHGLGLRFYIENTTEAMADAASGANWLMIAISLLGLGSWISWKISSSRWTALAVASPVIAATSAVLYDGNILPYFAALLTGSAAAIGAVVTIITAVRKSPLSKSK